MKVNVKISQDKGWIELSKLILLTVLNAFPAKFLILENLLFALNKLLSFNIIILRLFY